MNQENNNQINITKKPFYKKIWYSITKYEKYAEMASEGVGRAIGYLCLLILIFSIFISIALIIRIKGATKEGLSYIDKIFTEINYKDGILSVKPENTTNSSFGNVIINTGELTEEQIKQYENSKSNNLEFIWLKDKVIAKYSSNSMTYYYKDILENFEIKEFNKESLINYLSTVINRPQMYIVYGLVIMLYTFIIYFISALIDVLILSLFGMITTVIAKIKMRYRAVFNMSVYAITLSTVLRLVYLYIETFTDFTIKYFDLMYTAISFICLAAAIFMIKSDVIKQQMEIMKMIQIKKEQQEEEKEKTEDKEKKEDKEKEEDKKEEEDNQVEDKPQGEGSNA